MTRGRTSSTNDLSVVAPFVGMSVILVVATQHRSIVEWCNFCVRMLSRNIKSVKKFF